MRAALIQLCASDDPAEGLEPLRGWIAEAAAEGADLICTPEVTNAIATSRARRDAVLRTEEADPTLAMVREEAARLGVRIALGSLALKTGGDRLANRSFLVGPDGAVEARYDKLHMFDVEVGAGESYRESAAYAPGDRAVIARTDTATLGLTICYDLRFPHLFRDLAKAGAEVILVPSAFSPTTGPAHWEVLLRARAIECGAFVLAAAQSGAHRTEKPRSSHGHSLAVGPWGEVLADAGTALGVTLVDLDLAAVAAARRRLPSLTHDRAYEAPA